MASGSPRGGRTVVVTGAAGPLGRRVLDLLAADDDVERIVALDDRPLAWRLDGVEDHQVDLGGADLKALFEGAATVLHLTRWGGPQDEVSADRVAGAARVLDAAAAVSASQVVVLSSATAYGAWANNPVPLTEDAPLRPNPGVALAAEAAEIERLVAEWRDEHPSARVAILRPTVTVAAEGNDWLAEALSRSSSLPVTDDEPPAQYLDLDDLAQAIDLARRAGLDGPRNVAPDGWIDGETVRALAGGGPRFRVPERAALRLARLGWRWGWAPTPPVLLPYTAHPWVIANDRLTADGWAPTLSNEEAYVGAHRAGPWATLSPRRRQELALGAAGVGIVAAVIAVVAVVRRRRRR